MYFFSVCMVYLGLAQGRAGWGHARQALAGAGGAEKRRSRLRGQLELVQVTVNTITSLVSDPFPASLPWL